MDVSTSTRRCQRCYVSIDWDRCGRPVTVGIGILKQHPMDVDLSRLRPSLQNEATTDVERHRVAKSIEHAGGVVGKDCRCWITPGD